MSDNPIKIKAIEVGYEKFEDFEPSPAKLEDLVDLKVVETTTHAGTYGMGGPGFIGLKLDNEKIFIISLWGATGWVKIDGKILDDGNWEGQDELNEMSDNADNKLNALIGKKIVSYECFEKSMKMEFDNGTKMTIDESPEERPRWKGTGELKIIDSDLREGCFLSDVYQVII